jgi:hypothetical protein
MTGRVEQRGAPRQATQRGRGAAALPEAARKPPPEAIA